MIKEVLRCNTTLTTLFLRCLIQSIVLLDDSCLTRVMSMLTVNSIGDDGARIISEGLKSNSTLTALNLSGKDQKNERRKNQF